MTRTHRIAQVCIIVTSLGTLTAGLTAIHVAGRLPDRLAVLALLLSGVSAIVTGGGIIFAALKEL